MSILTEMTVANPSEKQAIIDYAKELGFSLVRISSAQLPKHYRSRFDTWIEEGKHADMEYLANREKMNEELLPGAKTVICLAINYFNGTLKDETPNPLEPTAPAKNNEARVARYAVTRDYHKIFKSKLKKLATYIESTFNARTRYYNDTGPILERAYAHESGLGYTGNNSCIITREFGSWVLLAEIFTDLDLPTDQEPVKLSCGTCTRCIDLCPTKAINSDYSIDSRKCISYLTIENRGPIPIEFRDSIGNWIFGCDICQDVCPHNAKAQPTKVKDFQEIRITGRRLKLSEILSIEDDEEFLELFAGSPLMRAKRFGLVRNACIVAGNSGRQELIPLLQKIIEEASAFAPDQYKILAEHAQWAIDKLEAE